MTTANIAYLSRRCEQDIDANAPFYSPRISFHPTECPHCGGQGETYGYGTNDPGERARWTECPRCDGDGWEPEQENEE